jgi:alginate O-acetyltransferase complex protein AlgI
MLFNSLSFLIFLPIFCLCFFLLHGRQRLFVILLGSYFFYAWWDYRLLPVLILMTISNYYLGHFLDASQNTQTRRRLLALGVSMNLFVLVLFKYLGLFTSAVTTLAQTVGFGRSTVALHFILPVGISFYIFEMISYLVEIFRRKLEPSRDILKFSIFLSFFPRLVAGPILRPQSFLPQLDQDQRPGGEEIWEGVEMALWGLFKKMALADTLATYVDPILSAPFAFNANTLRVATLFYSVQIYCDFSGYSSIAIGVGKVLGFDLGKNFDKPYFSTSLSEFWTRWHISLSSWLRDYLYIPLGGSRGSRFETYRNLMFTMLLGGLWHGANWTFMLWGGIHGCYLILERLTSAPLARISVTLSIPSPIRSFVAGLCVFTLVTLAWIPFRAPDFASAGHVLFSVLGSARPSLQDVPNKFQLYRDLFLILMVGLLEFSDVRFRFSQTFNTNPLLRPIAGAALLLALSLFSVFGSHAFIYFQF